MTIADSANLPPLQVSLAAAVADMSKRTIRHHQLSPMTIVKTACAVVHCQWDRQWPTAFQAC